MDSSDSYDVAVIGAGIAGASAACELAASARVILLEGESQPGYHTTGRSAALFSTIYGPDAIRALTRASVAFFADPPDGFATAPLLTPRGVMMVGREDQLARVEAMFRSVSAHDEVQTLDAAEIRRRMPLLRPGYAAAALVEEGASDIDVHALHHGYLRRFRAAGGTLSTDSAILSLDRDGCWRIGTRRGTIRAGVVVNAAGAWADEIGRMAGARPIRLIAKRRTALVIPAPSGNAPSHWPMVVDIDEQFYLKPDAGRLLISPADETPSPPCDAQPEELDIALCIDRIETAFDLKVERVENKWAGLRSFVRDKTPVVGFDADRPGFFWLAGQGGYGIQSAPALARTAAALILGSPLPADIAHEGVTEAALSPARLEHAA